MTHSEKKDLEYYRNLPYSIVLEKYEDHGTYWVARVLELPHCLIHGNTPEEALKEIQEVKIEWIESNLEDGLPIPEPEPESHEYSGQIRLRIPPSLHRQLSYKAAIEDVSLNQYMTAALARSIGQVEETPKRKYRKIKAKTTGATKE